MRESSRPKQDATGLKKRIVAIGLFQVTPLKDEAQLGLLVSMRTKVKPFGQSDVGQPETVSAKSVRD
jgi:hypothetical protein